MCDSICSYKIRHFKSSKDKDFADALIIYNANTSPEIKTDPREIAYWVDHQSDNSKREFLCFGLYVNDMLVGFAETGYLPTSRLMVIDYFSLIKEYRRNSVFYPLFSLVENYYNSSGRLYSYIVAEVNNKNSGVDIDKESSFSKKMLILEDFQIVDALYYQPVLGIERKESFLECLLLIRTAEELKTIPKSTYIKIVSDIYYNHYLSWFPPFLSGNDVAIYENEIKNILEKINNATQEDIHIKKNPRSSDNILAQGTSIEKTSGPTPDIINPASKGLKIGIAVSMIVILISIGLLVILRWLEIENIVFWSCAALIIGLILSITSLYCKKAMNALRAVANYFEKFF